MFRNKMSKGKFTTRKQIWFADEEIEMMKELLVALSNSIEFGTLRLTESDTVRMGVKELHNKYCK